MKFNRIALYAILFSILCLGGSYKAWADDEEETYGQPESHDFIKHRAYIGFFGTSATIDTSGDFNGFVGYTFPPSGTSNAELDYIPAINRNFGWAAMAGYRENAWAAEISYWYSNHTANVYNGVDASGNPVTLLSTTAVYSTINLDLKRYFFTSLPIQPFILGGMNFSFLSSHDTSELLNNAQTNVILAGNQTESGFGLNLGIGAELYVGDGFSILGGATQRFTSWAGITGAGKVNETPAPLNSASNPTGSLEGNGLNFYLGATFGLE